MGSSIQKIHAVGSGHKRPRSVLDMSRARQKVFWPVLIFAVVQVSWAQQTPPPGLDQSKSFMQKAEELRLQAKPDHPDTQTQLAEMYERGLGVPQSFTKAIDLYRQAALAGYQPARVKLESLGVRVLTEPEAETDDTDEAVGKTPPSARITINVGTNTVLVSGSRTWSTRAVIVTRTTKQRSVTLGRSFLIGQRQLDVGSFHPRRGARSGFTSAGFN